MSDKTKELKGYLYSKDVKVRDAVANGIGIALAKQTRSAVEAKAVVNTLAGYLLIDSAKVIHACRKYTSFMTRLRTDKIQAYDFEGLLGLTEYYPHEDIEHINKNFKAFMCGYQFIIDGDISDGVVESL